MIAQVCVACGTARVEGTETCARCGLAEFAQPRTATPRPPAEPPRTNGRRRAVGIVLLAVAGAGVLAIVAYRAGSRPDTVVAGASTERPVGQGPSVTRTSAPTAATTRSSVVRTTTTRATPTSTRAPVTATTTARATTTTTRAATPVPLVPVAVSASCTSGPATDAAGNATSYEPELAIDGDPSTAWRCDGDASGELVRLQLPSGVATVLSVGLIPGYDKIDPKSGVDRFAEMRRIASVRWRCIAADGATVAEQRQSLSDSRREQRVAVRFRGCAVIEMIVESTRPPGGTLNYTPVSEVFLAGEMGT